MLTYSTYNCILLYLSILSILCFSHTKTLFFKVHFSTVLFLSTTFLCAALYSTTAFIFNTLLSNCWYSYLEQFFPLQNLSVIGSPTDVPSCHCAIIYQITTSHSHARSSVRTSLKLSKTTTVTNHHENISEMIVFRFVPKIVFSPGY